MSTDTQWCALCGTEYVAGVAECVDCLVPLVAAPPRTVDSVGSEDEGQIVYELEGLDNDDRFAIDAALEEVGILRAWDEGSLVVREADEERVDEIVERTGRAVGLEDGEQIAYELEGWNEQQRTELGDLLAKARIPHDFDDNGDLVVLEDDEERVDVMIDSIDFPDQLPAEDDEGDGGSDVDGLAATDALSELFVAADRLMHDPEDHEGVLSLVDAARLAESLPLPYGFAPAVWKDLVGQATALRHLLEGEADDDTVMERARELRAMLRQWV